MRGFSREFWIGFGLAIFGIGFGAIITLVTLPSWIRIATIVLSLILMAAGFLTMAYFGFVKPSPMVAAVPSNSGSILDPYGRQYPAVVREYRWRATKWTTPLVLVAGLVMYEVFAKPPPIPSVLLLPEAGTLRLYNQSGGDLTRISVISVNYQFDRM